MSTLISVDTLGDFWVHGCLAPQSTFRPSGRHHVMTKYMPEDKVHAHFMDVGKQRQEQIGILMTLSVDTTFLYKAPNYTRW